MKPATLNPIAMRENVASQIGRTDIARPEVTRSGIMPGGMQPGSVQGPGSFHEVLEKTQARAAQAAAGAERASGLQFSQHALSRIQSRGLSFAPGELNKIQTAVDRAAQKGGANTLVISDNKALIVNTKNQTVVTIMDQNHLKENVFTNIDSTVFA